MKYKYWKWVFTGTCLVIGILVLYKVRAILGPFFLAFVLAFLLNPFVEVLERYKISRNKSIAIVFTIIAAVLAATIFLVLPIIYSQLNKLLLVLPNTIQLITETMNGYREQFKASGLPSQVSLVLDQQIAQGEILIANYLNMILSNLPNVLSTFTLYMLSPVISIYLLADWKNLGNGFYRIIPQRWRMEWRRLWQDINHVIRQFIRGDLLIALIVGTLIGIGVKLVGMEYALLIGLICGIFDIIPYFGPVIGAVPAILLALTISPVMAVKVALVIFLVQQLEGNIISPKLMGESVGLHPLWVIFALLACGELAGFWGLFLAVPLAAVIRVVFNHVYYRLVSTKV